MKFVLMDVEGTTTSISFVHDVLFPYSRNHLKQFLNSHREDEEVAEILKNTKESVNREENLEVSFEQIMTRLETWILEDRKHPALKKLQGLIWKNGYSDGELKGHIYVDVPEAFKKWKDLGMELGVYSSGSIEAQKLLFRYSDFGDLTSFLSYHFDTTSGHKREVQSYINIANNLNIAPADILFLSDIKEELDAARLAGYATTQLVRTLPITYEGHLQVNHFLEVQLP